MSKKISIFILLILMVGGSLHAELINIGIFADYKIKEFAFNPRAGKYAIFTENGKLREVTSKEQVEVFYEEGLIRLRSAGKNLGRFRKVNFIGIGWYNHFKVSVKSPIQKEVRYDDNLKLLLLRDRMQLVNNIDLDNYIAGVVEAEVGRRPVKEYFKLQAIICRTYALSNAHKHYIEGYNLCDRVHCQAYHGKSFYEDIVDAALQTRGSVIVDSDIKMITAAFHSNCGGQTVNSEDVWSKSLYYLSSVEDTFCLNQRNAHWDLELASDRWKQYLYERVPIASRDSLFPAFQQYHRKVYFSDGKLPLEDIRHDWKLRSTFFNVAEEGNKVILHGKGYGHGVGLCQEGAMEMARRGFSYADILHYYYRGVHIIDLSALDFFKED